MKDIEQFIQTHADADGNVSDADMTKLLTGGHQGDTAAGQPADTGVPAAGSDANNAPAPAAGSPASPPAQAPAAAPPAAVDPTLVDESKAVILARDGVHTIDFQKLVDAREEARAAKAEAEEWRSKAADLMAKATAPAAAAPAAPTAAPDGSIFGDYSDEAIKKGLQTLAAEAAGKSKSEMAAELEPLKQHMAHQAAEAHFNAINAKHPDVGSIVESTEFNRWVDAQPSFVRDAYKVVLEKGTATQVVEMLDTYRTANPAKSAAAPAVDVSKQVDDAIAKAKLKAPSSLSDIPAGSAAHHDEAGAMAEMSTTDLMTKFAGKSPAEIEAMVRRLV
jgi:hypothetical protein